MTEAEQEWEKETDPQSKGASFISTRLFKKIGWITNNNNYILTYNHINFKISD